MKNTISPPLPSTHTKPNKLFIDCVFGFSFKLRNKTTY